jgi:cold shock CspA family protein
VCKKCGVGGHFIQDCPTKQLEAAAAYLATQGQGADAETLQAIVEAQAKSKLDAARKAAEDMLDAQRAKQLALAGQIDTAEARRAQTAHLGQAPPPLALSTAAGLLAPPPTMPPARAMAGRGVDNRPAWMKAQPPPQLDQGPPPPAPTTRKEARYRAALDAGHISREQYDRAVAEPEDSAPAERAAPTKPGALVDRVVRVTTGAHDKKLSGKHGVVVAWDSRAARYEVRVVGKKRTAALMAGHLEAIDDAAIIADVRQQLAAKDVVDEPEAAPGTAAPRAPLQPPQQQQGPPPMQYPPPQQFQQGPPQGYPPQHYNPPPQYNQPMYGGPVMGPPPGAYPPQYGGPPMGYAPPPQMPPRAPAPPPPPPVDYQALAAQRQAVPAPMAAPVVQQQLEEIPGMAGAAASSAQAYERAAQGQQVQTPQVISTVKTQQPGEPPEDGRLERGRILWFDRDKNFGFIAAEAGGENVFIHGFDVKGFEPDTSRAPVKGDLAVFIRGRDVGERLKANEAEVFPEPQGGPLPPAFINAGPQAAPAPPMMMPPQPPPPMLAAPASTYVNPFLKKSGTEAPITAPSSSVELAPGVTRPPTPPPADKSLPPPSTAGRHVGFCKWWDRPKAFGFLGRDLDAPASDDDVFVQELDLLCPALNVGDVVEFSLGGKDAQTKKLKACDVKLIRAAAVSQQKQVSGRQRGTVKWFDPSKQYGFVAPDGGVPDKDDVFAHQYDVVDGGNALTQGERVEYDWAPSSEPGGRPKALRVNRIATGFATRDDHFQHLRQPPMEGAFLYAGKFCRGQVMWYDPVKTFGFVRGEFGQSQQDDVFIHGNDVREQSPLVPGDSIIYKALVHRGRPKAVEVARDPNARPPPGYQGVPPLMPMAPPGNMHDNFAVRTLRERGARDGS